MHAYLAVDMVLVAVRFIQIHKCRILILIRLPLFKAMLPLCLYVLSLNEVPSLSYVLIREAHLLHQQTNCLLVWNFRVPRKQFLDTVMKNPEVNRLSIGIQFFDQTSKIGSIWCCMTVAWVLASTICIVSPQYGALDCLAEIPK